MSVDRVMIEKAAGIYISDRIIDIADLGGHINRSYLIVLDRKNDHRGCPVEDEEKSDIRKRPGTEIDKYVLQCLNPDLYGGHILDLEQNYELYREACRRARDGIGEWYCPEWLKDHDGHRIHVDRDGLIWRMYPHIDGDDRGEISPYAAGEGIGRLHRILRHCDPQGIKAVLPHIHDLRYFFDEYLRLADSDIRRDPDLDRAIASGIDEYLSLSVPDGAVIHGDAKVDNMIIRDGHVVGFIDLDTLMPGSVFDDMSDALRSICADRRIGTPDEERIDRFCEGYRSGSGTAIAGDDLRRVIKNTMKNRFMLGLRYYTDYLAGNVYFAETYPGRNLDRARELLLI